MLRLLRRHRRRDAAGASTTASACRRSPTASATTRSSAPACIAGAVVVRVRRRSSALRTREDDDFTIGLIDAFACAADVLTFYQERIANESYLRTAIERVSLQEMGKLDRLPAASRRRGRDLARLRARHAADAAAGLAPDPGNFVTGVPATLTLDVGPQGAERSRVPTRSRRPSRRSRRSDARAAWNAMRPWLSEARLPVRGDAAGLARRRRAPTSSPAMRCCSSATSSSPAPTQRRLGLSPDRPPSSSTPRTIARALPGRAAWAHRDPFSNPPRAAAVCSPCASARPCSATTRRCGAAWIREFRSDYAAEFGGSADCRRMGRLHHHAEYRRAPRPARSISTRSSPRSRPMCRVTSRGAASRSSPRATSIGPTKTFRAAPTSSSTG